jgi:hypothetical protein
MISASAPFATALALALLAGGDRPAKPPFFPPSFADRAWICDLGNGEKSVPIAIVDESDSQFFSSHLRAAGERSLYQASLQPRAPGDETLRLTWLRSFHAPMTVRIEMHGGKARLYARQLSGKGGYGPGEVARSIERPLAAGELASLRARLAATHIFDTQAPACEIVIDGSIWILERVDAHGYQYAERRSPEGGELYDLGLGLLGLTHWDLKPLY